MCLEYTLIKHAHYIDTLTHLSNTYMLSSALTYEHKTTFYIDVEAVLYYTVELSRAAEIIVIFLHLLIIYIYL